MMQKSRTQDGFVSIVVSMIIMVVLSLITLGFARLMNREQRQALDRQLSSQAFYAAESGVNDVINNPIGNTNTCAAQSDISTDYGVRVTCVTYTDTVDRLEYAPVPLDLHTPKVFRLPTGASQLRIDFRANAPVVGDAASRADMNLPPLASWGTQPGAMKVRIISYTNGSGREQLFNSTDFFTLIPRAGAIVPSGTTFSPSTAGRLIAAPCSGVCSVTLTGIPTANNITNTVVISSLYRANDAVVTALNASANPVLFQGVQALIDSTARTTDVVRRIQVRRPLTDGYQYPAAALEATGNANTDGICKRLQVNSGLNDTGGCSTL
jgi:hypothetical protein